MGLFAYHRQVTRLLREERQQQANPKDLTDYVNLARGQLAGEAECIRVEGTISTVVGVRNYNFANVNIGVAASTGIQGIINVRRIHYAIAAGRKIVWPRPWVWFDNYFLNNPIPSQGFPVRWAQYGQGSSNAGAPSGGGVGGSFYLDPMPDTQYMLFLDCVCYPQQLVLDTDADAIPYLFSDAVPFLAAWYALVAQQADKAADRMMMLYQTFLGRARQFANPAVERRIYSQASDPIRTMGTQQNAV